jgi:hypothetical protein
LIRKFRVNMHDAVLREDDELQCAPRSEFPQRPSAWGVLEGAKTR